MTRRKASTARRIRRPLESTGVEVSEQDGVRYLHLGSDLVQSAMRLGQPHDLEIAYTRCMMAALLFQPRPRNVVIVGLGGGSLVKFIRHHLPATHIVAVEINPQVVAAAKSFFSLPPEDDQFSISIGDAAEYLAAHPATCDLLLCDGYDDGTLPPALSCESFYVSAAAALRGNGVLATNFLGRDRRLKTYLKRLGENFAESKRLDDGEDGNVVMLAFRRSVGMGSKGLQRRARQLEQRYGLPFTRYCEELAER